LKQRIVKGGRDVNIHWEKLEDFKDNCTAGCDFAAHAEKLVSPSEMAKMVESERREELKAINIVSQEDIDASTRMRREWTDTLRMHCFERCSAKYPGSKDARMCSDGCDAFFNFLI
jgi:hypothetical protein